MSLPVPRKTPPVVRSAGHAQAVRIATDAFSVVLLDCSGSMNQAIGDRRRTDILADILRQVLPAIPDARLVAFTHQSVI
jgi:hypothetical protein